MCLSSSSGGSADRQSGEIASFIHRHAHILPSSLTNIYCSKDYTKIGTALLPLVCRLYDSSMICDTSAAVPRESWDIIHRL